VIAIHTDAGLLGTKGVSGHVDFFANGGRTKDQPACTGPIQDFQTTFEQFCTNVGLIIGLCGHKQALLYLDRALLGEKMLGCRCQFRKNAAPFRQPCPKPKNCELNVRFGFPKLPRPG